MQSPSWDRGHADGETKVRNLIWHNLAHCHRFSHVSLQEEAASSPKSEDESSSSSSSSDSSSAAWTTSEGLSMPQQHRLVVTTAVTTRAETDSKDSSWSDSSDDEHEPPPPSAMRGRSTAMTRRMSAFATWLHFRPLLFSETWQMKWCAGSLWPQQSSSKHISSLKLRIQCDVVSTGLCWALASPLLSTMVLGRCRASWCLVPGQSRGRILGYQIRWIPSCS